MPCRDHLHNLLPITVHTSLGEHSANTATVLFLPPPYFTVISLPYPLYHLVPLQCPAEIIFILLPITRTHFSAHSANIATVLVLSPLFFHPPPYFALKSLPYPFTHFHLLPLTAEWGGDTVADAVQVGTFTMGWVRMIILIIPSLILITMDRP